MSEFLGTVLIMIVLWFGGTLILGGKSTIDAPIFIYYMVILYSIINPIKDFAKAGYAIPKGMASMERINLLYLKRFPLKVLSHDTHHPHHQRGEKDGEGRHLPADHEKGGEVEENQDRVLDEHLDRSRDGILHLLHVTAHPGDDVAFLLLREEAQRKGQDLVVDVHPDVLHHTRPDRHHHGGRAEVASRLQRGHHHKEYAQNDFLIMLSGGQFTFDLTRGR